MVLAKYNETDVFFQRICNNNHDNEQYIVQGDLINIFKENLNSNKLINLNKLELIETQSLSHRSFMELLYVVFCHIKE